MEKIFSTVLEKDIIHTGSSFGAMLLSGRKAAGLARDVLKGIGQ